MRKPSAVVTSILITGLALATTLAPREAGAFCGFYVAGASAELFNEATMVVLMRVGSTTVLSMRNDYQGPPEDFALVVPVPEILDRDDVQTLPPELFEHVDRFTAPRLVEYWERDPCDPERRHGVVADAPSGATPSPEVPSVTVEAEFVVGEYEIVVLSAADSLGLDTWLRAHDYNIPPGAEPLLRPYVQSGMNFFVAKVDASKVAFETNPDGTRRAHLSPLRFAYHSEQFSLPVRLGLINADGPQDLLIHVIGEARYEVANRDDVTIPTNIVVPERVRDHFGEFYTALFDHTLATHPGAVVTEYAMDIGSCDPCPTELLDRDELDLLGLDEIREREKQVPYYYDLAITRLHARYDASSLGEDLVFERAPRLYGGFGTPRFGELDPRIDVDDDLDLSHASRFQARYAILHYWSDIPLCFDPLYDRWGEPPVGPWPAASSAAAPNLDARDLELSDYVSRSAHLDLGLAGPPPPDRRRHRAQVAAHHNARGRPLRSYSYGPGARAPNLLIVGGLAVFVLVRLRRRLDVEQRKRNPGM